MIGAAQKGRKYQALLYSIAMWFVILTCMMMLRLQEAEIPSSFQTAFIILTGTIPAYLGSNVYQKGNELRMGAAPAAKKDEE